MDKKLSDVDILFVKQRPDEIESSLESLVRLIAHDEGDSYQSLSLNEIPSDLPSAKMLFYEPDDASSVFSRLHMQGLRRKNQSAPIVLVCDAILEQRLLEGEQTPNAFALSSNSPHPKIYELVSKLKEQYWRHPSIAVVLAEKNGRGRVYRETLKSLGMRVDYFEGAEVRSEILGKYIEHQTPPAIVVVEGDNAYDPIFDDATKKFPDAKFYVMGDEEHGVAAFKKSAIFIDRSVRNIGQVLKGYARSIGAQMVIEPTGRVGKCYLFTGPTCAGKTEGRNQLQELNLETPIINIQKHTTRVQRGGEIDGKSFLFNTEEEFAKRVRNKSYFFTFDMGTAKYGITEDVPDLLRGGNDICITLTDPAVIPRLQKAIEQRLQQPVVVPVLFYATLETLQRRLMLRDSELQEKVSRLKRVGGDLEQFLAQPELYKYAINTTNFDAEGSEGYVDVRKILKGIVQWERAKSGTRHDYASFIVSKLLPLNFQKQLKEGNHVMLNIPRDVVEEYAEKSHMTVKEVEKNTLRRVICSSTAYGRQGIFLESWNRHDPGVQSRDMTLDLIEMTIGIEARDRSAYRRFFPISIYGRCSAPSTSVNDGLLYMLGDELRRPDVNAGFNAVTFGFVRGSPESALLSAREKDLEYLSKELLRANKFI